VAVMPVSVVWTRTVGPKRPQVCVNVWRGEVSGRGEVPGVGANLDGEGGAVTKVENHSLRSVHPPARLDLSVLYGRYCFSYGLENRLQFVLGGGPIILGCSPLLACWLSIRAPSALANDLYLPTPRISYPCLALPRPPWRPSSVLQAGGVSYPSA